MAFGCRLRVHTDAAAQLETQLHNHTHTHTQLQKNAGPRLVRGIVPRDPRDAVSQGRARRGGVHRRPQGTLPPPRRRRAGDGARRRGAAAGAERAVVLDGCGARARWVGCCALLLFLLPVVWRAGMQRHADTRVSLAALNRQHITTPPPPPFKHHTSYKTNDLIPQIQKCPRSTSSWTASTSAASASACSRGSTWRCTRRRATPRAPPSSARRGASGSSRRAAGRGRCALPARRLCFVFEGLVVRMCKVVSQPGAFEASTLYTIIAARLKTATSNNQHSKTTQTRPHHFDTINAQHPTPNRSPRTRSPTRARSACASMAPPPRSSSMATRSLRSPTCRRTSTTWSSSW